MRWWVGFLSLTLFLLGSTAQLRPWPPPQNPAEFLGGFSTIFFNTRSYYITEFLQFPYNSPVYI
jgi:hypothetical protein